MITQSYKNCTRSIGILLFCATISPQCWHHLWVRFMKKDFQSEASFILQINWLILVQRGFGNSKQAYIWMPFDSDGSAVYVVAYLRTRQPWQSWISMWTRNTLQEVKEVLQSTSGRKKKTAFRIMKICPCLQLICRKVINNILFL